MQTYSDLFERELTKLIMEEIDASLHNLSFGGGVSDYAEYKSLIGKIAAFREVLSLMETARSEVNKAR
jgi:hypothetical protein